MGVWGKGILFLSVFLDARLLVLLCVSRETPDQQGIRQPPLLAKRPVPRSARAEPCQRKPTRIRRGSEACCRGKGPWENVNRILIRPIVFIPMSPRLNRFPLIALSRRRSGGRGGPNLGNNNELFLVLQFQRGAFGNRDMTRRATWRFSKNT